MNRLTACTVLVTLIASTVTVAEPVTQSRAWTEAFAVNTNAPRITISNIWGSVRVRSGPDRQVSVTVDEQRSAPTRALFDLSTEVLRLESAADTNGVTFIVGDRATSWQRHEPCPGCRVDYQFDVVVPHGAVLDIATVLDGAVDVAGVDGPVSASNVNGPIRLDELRNCAVLESVNGPVSIVFVEPPRDNCAIETVNGDVTLSIPNGSGLDVALNSFNGRLFSGFTVQPFALPAQVEHTRSNGRHQYRIQQSAGLRLEAGGPMFSISSLNGDIRIQKNQ